MTTVKTQPHFLYHFNSDFTADERKKLEENINQEEERANQLQKDLDAVNQNVPDEYVKAKKALLVKSIKDLTDENEHLEGMT